MDHTNLFAIVSRRWLLAALLTLAPATGAWAQAETSPATAAPTAPAAEAPKPAEPAPTPAPEAAKPAEAAPAPAAEAPKPAEAKPSPAAEAPKLADVAPKPAAEAPETKPTDTPAKAAADAPEKRLRFTFRYQRWSDVLEWFAEQADLSLVLDAPPPGTFNYSDNRDYSVAESLDLLNSVLLTKGYTLIRRERMLTLIDVSDEFPEGLIPKVTLEEVEKRGTHELVTVEFSLGRRDPEAVTAAVTPLLGPFHKLLAVAPTKQLFVTDRAGVMSGVNKVVQSLPETPVPPQTPTPPKPEPPELKVYPIEKEAPDAVVPILEKFVPTAQLVFDPNLNQLHANATPTQHTTIQKILDQIRSAASTDRERRVEVYRLEQPAPKSAANLIEMLKAVVPKATVSVQEDGAALVVWASPAEHETVKAALSKLGGGPTGDPLTSPQLELYRLTRVDPAKLLTMLEKLVPDAKLSYDERSRSLIALAKPADQQAIGATLKQIQAEGDAQQADQPRFETYEVRTAGTAAAGEAMIAQIQPLAPEAKFTFDARTGRLIVYGSSQEQQLVKAALEKLQAEPAAERQPQFEIHEIRPGAAAATETAVTQLQTVVPEAKITVDARTGRLIVYGTAQEQQRVKAALEKLGLAKATGDDRTMEAYPLAGADMTATQTLLQQLVPMAEFTADATQQRLVAVASAADHERIKSTLEKLRPNPADPQSAQLRFYPFEQEPPADVLDLLGKVAPQAKITVDKDNERLMVVAPPTSQTAVETAFQQFQKATPTKGKPELATYPLKASDPTSVLEMAKARYPKAQVVLDATNKRLLVWAPPEDQAELAASIQKLEAEPAAADQPRFESYPLHGFADATTAGTLVTSLQPLVPNARFTIDSKVKNLIVWATDKEHETVRRALERLGQGPAPQNTPQLEVHRLVKADAATTLALLQKLAPEAQLTLDAKSSNLIALAVPADQQLIRATLQQLQPGLTADAGPAIRFHPLVRAPSEGLLNILKEMVPDAQLTPDAENKRLVAVATEEDHEAIQKIIEQFESSTPPEEPRKLAVYPVTAAQKKRFEAVLPSLQTDMPGLQVLTDADPGSLTIWAKPSEQIKIGELIKQLERDVPQSEQLQLAAYTCAAADPATISTFVTALFPDAKFVVDPKTRRILVWARPQDHEKIKPALEQLGSGTPGDFETEFRAYPLSKIPADVAVPLLQPQLPEAKLFADAQSKRVLAWASKADHAIIAQTIEQLQSGPDDPDKPRLVVYPRGEADPQTLLQMLTSLVPTARLAVDSQTGGLAAWATPDEHETIRKAVEEMSKEAVTASKPTTKAYALKNITAVAALPVLTTAVPTAKVSAGADESQVVAVAQPREHQIIGAILQEIDVEGAAAARSAVAVYVLEQQTSPTAMSYALSLLTQAFPRARFLLGTEPGQFVAWATAKDQQEIKALVDRLNAGPPPEEAPEATVYSLKHISAATALTLLTTAVPTAKLTPDAEDTRRLTAFASPADQAAIKQILEKIDVAGDAASDATVGVYELEGTTAASSLYYTLTVFRTAFPKATFSLGAEANQFVAWATAKEHEGITALVAQLNAAPAPEDTPTIAVYPLQWITAATATTVLQAAVPKATFTADAADPQRLTVLARPADHARIKAMVAELDVEGGGGGRSGVAVYVLEQQTSPTAMSYALSLLTQAFPRARFLLGTEPGQFVAWATAKDQQEIKALVDRLNAGPPPEEAPEATVYTLKHITATTALSLLTTAVPKAKLSPDIEDTHRLTAYASPADHATIEKILEKIDVEGEARGGEVVAVYTLTGPTAASSLYYTVSVFRTAFPKATISIGAEAGQFVAWASPKDQEGIKALVDQLNAGPPPEEAPLATVYPLKHILATTALNVLTAAVPKAKLTPDAEDTRRLTAFASPADQATIKGILEQIDIEGDAAGGATVALYKLEGATAASSLYYTLTVFRTAFPKATFSLGAEANQFLAWANAKDHAGIQALVDQLNAAPPPEEAPLATVYPLKHILATTALNVLTAAVPKAKLTPDTEDTRRLTAFASPADQATIKGILEQIDIEGDLAGGETIGVYQLQGQATATSLYYTLAVFRTAFPKATFSAGADAGQFVAWASAKDHAGIKALVEQINAGPPPEQKPQVVLYALKFITAAAASQVLQTAVPNATFTTDPDDPQRLTASARAADHETIKTVLEEIDVEGEGGGRSSVQIYKLQGQQAATSMTYALQLWTTAFPRARFSLGTEPSQFVAWASPKDHKDIQALVDRLNAAPPPDQASKATVYTLKNISATTAMSVLRSAVPRATLTPDAADPQRLTAYATPLEHATINDILQQIDTESDPNASFTVSIYTMEGMSTRALYYTGLFLAQVVPNAKFTPGSEEGQMVVWATAKDHAQIKTLIEQLQKAPPPELARTIKVYTLQHVTADAVMVFLQSAVSKAEVTADPADPQRINAWATPADHKTIDEVLKQMDAKPDPESAATARVYQLEGMSQTGAYYALRFLREAVPRANFALGGEGGQVVVWARAQDHETIRGLIKQLVEEAPDAARTAQVYSLKHATATTALQALAGVVPQAALSAGADPSQLVAFARPRDHAKIAEVLKELDKEAPADTVPQAVVYTLQSGSTTEAMRVLRTAVPTASLSVGAEPHQMIAWARPADHKIIAEIVERLAEKGPAELARKVAVYTLEAGDAATAITFLQTAVPTAQFSVGSDPRRLIAWATPADHEAIEKAVEEMETGAGQMTSQVYRFRHADPQAAYTVLQALVPSAKMAIDAKEGSLVASGLPEDHVKIKATIDQMDGEDAEGQRPALKVHRVTVGSVANVYRSLSLLFREDATVQLSLDLDNDSVIAVASAAKHERIAELIKSIEDAARQDAQATLELYSLRNVDAASAQEILKQMLDKQGSKADISFDEISNQLVAIARPEVHEQIAKLLEQLRGPEPELEIYDLKYVDPASAEMAILRQFGDDAQSPEVSTDPVTQQLFIRATAEQQQKIRDLLIKMGETNLSLLRGRSSQNMRTIPFQGDPKAALEEIRRIWPKLRDNEIRVVSPDKQLPSQPPATAPKNKPVNNKTSQLSPSPFATEPASVVQRLLPYAPLTSTTSIHPTASEPPAPVAPVGRNKVLRSSGASQDDKPADEPAPPPDERPAKATRRKTTAASPPAKAPTDAPSPPPPAAPPPPAPAPLYVVPSGDSITIVCDDLEALDQFEKLLRAMSGSTGEIGRNLSVYELKHSNAVEMAEKLRELYDTRRTSWRWGAPEVRIVPDERLNRILVQGSRIDRETISGLIHALDTEEGTGTKPQIVPVRFAEAADIAEVVREVFRSQMSRYTAASSDGVRSFSRSRVTPEIAVDQATNSLIVMAPSPLLDEILKLIESLDQAAEQNPARRIKIIALQKTNAARIDEALQRILKSSSPRAPRSPR